jgi:protein-S-isoprenylcysteine O-methyltransferase Ste14
MQTEPSDHPGVVAWPPAIFAVALAAGIAAHSWLQIQLFPPLPARVAGSAVVCLAIGIALWAAKVMKEAGTNIHPHLPATTVVTAGPYALSRNPMYVSLCVLYVGTTLLIDGVMPLIFLAPLILVLHFGVIKREERYLARKFGEGYLGYKARVRRWV